MKIVSIEDPGYYEDSFIDGFARRIKVGDKVMAVTRQGSNFTVTQGIVYDFVVLEFEDRIRVRVQKFQSAESYGTVEYFGILSQEISGPYYLHHVFKI